MFSLNFLQVIQACLHLVNVLMKIVRELLARFVENVRMKKQKEISNKEFAGQNVIEVLLDYSVEFSERILAILLKTRSFQKNMSNVFLFRDSINFWKNLFGETRKKLK